MPNPRTLSTFGHAYHQEQPLKRGGRVKDCGGREHPHVELRYAVLLEPEPDGSAYNVIVPALPEAHTWGETVEEALLMAREVIELCVAERRAVGDEIPPSDAGTARLEAVAISLPAA
ncbi:MAG: type II toxin-antitoxin system HicB family antitoxin [Candidatus Eremiobacteraeota bacterium]|nr:type II toxin-antitoxin system HicB family antitoxin [Candidatus Eremiobacteraeota bacterium]MBC5821240.1 type II toxin-antitoxin system HicB family antitoxin [Candidatus Eremiobacteraeota bacterium]